MLLYQRDWQSIAYLLGLPALVIWQWQAPAFNGLLYTLTLLLGLGICCINHNHAHLPLWRNRWLNRISDYWIGTLQGHPVFLFEVAHINSHHRYNQSERDVTRVDRWGRHNHLLGYLIFPLSALGPLGKLKRSYFKQLRREQPLQLLNVILQHLPLLLLWSITLALDWQKSLLYILLPQLISLHFLLASNYLQHAKTEVGSRYNHSRNFVGAMNYLLFNVGFHAAHHEWERLHWSELPVAHQGICNQMNPDLERKSLIAYFVVDLLVKPLRGFSFR